MYFKISLCAFKSLNWSAPQYISELLAPYVPLKVNCTALCQTCVFQKCFITKIGLDKMLKYGFLPPFASFHLKGVNFATCRPSSPTLLHFSCTPLPFRSILPTFPQRALPILSASPPYVQSAKQTGRQRQKRPNTGRGPSPVGPLNAECLKITTWHWASHSRFQRKSNISFQNGPQRLLRVPALSFFCSLSPFFPWVSSAEPPHHMYTNAHARTHTHWAFKGSLWGKS